MKTEQNWEMVQLKETVRMNSCEGFSVTLMESAAYVQKLKRMVLQGMVMETTEEIVPPV